MYAMHIDRVIEDAAALMRCEPFDARGAMRALEYVRRSLGRTRGLRVSIRETQREPILVIEAGPTTGRCVAYVGHLDVVPPTTDGQCTPRIAGPVLIGRGSADMLLAVAAAMQAMRELAARGPETRVQLVLAVDEEQIDREHSMLEFARRFGEDVEFAIALEATDLRVGVQSKGAMRLAFFVEGKAAHSAYPLRGADAVTFFERRVLPALENAPFMRAKGTDLFPDGATIVRTTCVGGTAPTSVPGLYKGTLDVRYVPGLLPGEVLRQLRAAVPTSERFSVTLSPLGGMPAVATPPGHPCVRALLTVIARHHAVEPVEGRCGSADHAFFKLGVELGVLGENTHGRGERASIPSAGRLLDILVDLPAVVFADVPHALLRPRASRASAACLPDPYPSHIGSWTGFGSVLGHHAVVSARSALGGMPRASASPDGTRATIKEQRGSRKQ